MAETRVLAAILLLVVSACSGVGRDSSASQGTGARAATGGDSAETGGRTGGAASTSGEYGSGGGPLMAGGAAGLGVTGGSESGTTGGTSGRPGAGGSGGVVTGGAAGAGARTGGTPNGGAPSGGSLVSGVGADGEGTGGAAGGVEAGGAATGGSATGSRTVGSCDNAVLWDETRTSEQFANIATSDNRYRFSSGGWGWQGAGHAISLTSDCGFRVDEQSCSRTEGLCSFPVIYVGTDGDGSRTSGFTPTTVTSLSVVPICIAWFAAGSASGDDFNVVVEVWLGASADTTDPDRLLAIWLRDPPGFDPPGDLPVASGSTIETRSWDTWFAVDEANRYVVSYVSTPGVGEGRPETFDLMGFLTDAVDRGYVQPTDYVVSIRAGMQIQSGAANAAIDSFKAWFE